MFWNYNSWTQNNCWTQNILDLILFASKVFLDQEYFWSQNFFGSNSVTMEPEVKNKPSFEVNIILDYHPVYCDKQMRNIACSIGNHFLSVWSVNHRLLCSHIVNILHILHICLLRTYLNNKIGAQTATHTTNI